MAVSVRAPMRKVAEFLEDSRLTEPYFWYVLTPVLLGGSSVEALLGVLGYGRYVSVSLSVLATFLLVAVFWICSKVLFGEVSYKLLFVSGTFYFFCSFALAASHASNLVFNFLFISILIGLLGFKTARSRFFSLCSRTGVFCIYGQFLDAHSTYIVLDNGGSEINYFVDRLISPIGPFGIYLFKLLVVVVIMLSVKKELDDPWRTLVLWFVGLVGAAAGINNILGF